MTPRFVLPAALLCLNALASGPEATRSLRDTYAAKYATRMSPLVCEAIRFPTVGGNTQAVAAQQAWVQRTGAAFGLTVRIAGTVTEVDLAGPEGAPVLGLIVHGDVETPGQEGEWTVPPFAGIEKDGYIYGRGAADDKGPLVQALLAMATLGASGRPRTHTVRLLIGSDEEGDGKDMGTYLRTHRAPDVSLVLDASFPVVVGEKAWNTFTVTAAQPYAVRAPGARWEVVALNAGTGPSIVPGMATAVLRWHGDEEGAALAAAKASLLSAPLPAGFRMDAKLAGRELTLTMRGKAAHSGMNIEGGRNALVQLARLLLPQVAPSGARDLLAFAVETGQDLYGTALGLTATHPVWGRYAVNVAVLAGADGGKLALTLNLRRTPPMTGVQLKEHLERFTAAFNVKSGAALAPSGYFDEEPLVFDPNAKLVRRLTAAYERATGSPLRPSIAGGGTYAARVPNSIAFGMWFPGTPYPGHDVDERNSLHDLHRGVNVLLEALADLACSQPLVNPLQP